MAMQSLHRTRQVLRHALPLLLGVACCVFLAHQLDGFDMSAMWAGVQQVTPWRWGLALAFTGFSFLAVARYDVIALRHFQMSRPSSQAMRAGATAIALGQTLGAGVVVGAFVRWRMMPGLPLSDAARLAGFVAVTFLAALSVVIAAAALVLPTPHIPTLLPPLILIGAALLVLVAFFFPVLGRGGRVISLPTLPALLALLSLCVLDTVFAALALYVLLPETLTLGFATLLPVFLIALGAAIFSGTPGGVGPFELTLLALLPHVPEAELLAGVLAFRAVYYALPALIGGAILLSRLARKSATDQAAAAPALFLPFETLPDTPQARAELGVLRQNGGAILRCETGSCGIVRTGQTLTALFDPLDGHSGSLAAPLRRAARAQNRIVCKYKITARQAVHARSAGWSVLHISDEAVLDPSLHALDGPAYRQLRRKIRQAEKAGISLSEANAPLPLEAMEQVSRAWEDKHGVPRGFTMGRFDGPYVSGQRVYLAHDNGQLIGFVSFHVSQREWCLDLMRVLPEAPDGTMHALVHLAITRAAAAGAARLSLAAAPALPGGATLLERGLRRRFHVLGGGPGLRQFKSCFNPEWQPLFMAAPGFAQLTLAALDLIRSVRLRSAPATPITVAVQPSISPAS